MFPTYNISGISSNLYSNKHYPSFVILHQILDAWLDLFSMVEVVLSIYIYEQDG